MEQQHATIFAIPALVALLLSALTGCSAKAITDAELIGSWHAKSGLGSSLEKSAVLQFSADHTFTVTRLPRRYIWRDGDPGEVTAGQGTWHLAGKKGQQFQHIKFDFKSVGALGTGLHTEILADVVGGEPRLFFWEGEEGGKRFEFVRDPKSR